MQAIYFHNVSDEDFTGRWDSVDYPVKKGDKVLLQSYIAVHLAKQIAMREMGKVNKTTPIDTHTDELGNYANPVFKAEMAKYLVEDVIEAETTEKLEIAMIVEKKKAGRPKKVKEEEFPDLKK